MSTLMRRDDGSLHFIEAAPPATIDVAQYPKETVFGAMGIITIADDGTLRFVEPLPVPPPPVPVEGKPAVAAKPERHEYPEGVIAAARRIIVIGDDGSLHLIEAIAPPEPKMIAQPPKAEVLVQQYPKMKYHRDTEPVVVKDEHEESELGEGWGDVAFYPHFRYHRALGRRRVANAGEEMELTPEKDGWQSEPFGASTPPANKPVERSSMGAI